MSDEPKKRSRAWIGWTLIAAFALYPLSIGPATWFIIYKRPQLFEAWGTLYTPLFWAAHRSDALSGLLDRYTALWVDVSPF
jgi:hypothetical protein